MWDTCKIGTDNDQGAAVRPRSAVLSEPWLSADAIAAHLGVTKETVSRVISAFRRDRMIRLRAIDEVEIADRGCLEQLADCAG